MPVPKSLIVLAIVLVALIIAVPVCFDVVTIRGNEMGIKETWTQGVVGEPLHPKTYWLFPGWSQKVYKYDMSSQIFVMDNDADPEEIAMGRQSRAYKVQSVEGQDMTLSCNVRWRLNPAQLVEVHKTIRQRFAEKILRPELLRIIKDEATVKKAIEAYSGQGLVALQQSIEGRLAGEDSDVAKRGILVENFVLKGNELDPKYISEIKDKQVAVQKELRAKQEELAALADAKKAHAVAQADLNTQVVAAERDKQVGILDAEKLKQVSILGAEAEKEKLVLEATGSRDAEVLRAEGIVAVGEAEAAAIQLKMTAYSVPGSENYVTMETAKSMANAFENIRGYLPESMKVNVIAQSFIDGLKGVVGWQQNPVAE